MRIAMERKKEKKVLKSFEMEDLAKGIFSRVVMMCKFLDEIFFGSFLKRWFFISLN